MAPDHIRAIENEPVKLAGYPFVSVDINSKGENNGNNCSAKLRLLGSVPIKKVDVVFVRRSSVMLCAKPVGVRLNSGGLIVAEMTDVLTQNGNVNPGKACGLKEGDIITAVDGEKVCSVSGLIDAIKESGGRNLILTVTDSSGNVRILTLKPEYSQADECYRAGIWIRSSTAGIGVMTFFDSESGVFGGLGHAVCDETTGAVIGVSDGEVTNVLLTEAVRGASGAPGELIGFLGSERYGSLYANTEYGIYGHIEDRSIAYGSYETALRQEVREGKAQMLASVPGSDGAQLYDVVIDKIDYTSGNPTRNMIIRVTDERLLELTGGIVQGMSGSPIIQDGRFAAAVTHVFVNDPAMGYAIFAENMVAQAEQYADAA